MHSKPAIVLLLGTIFIAVSRPAYAERGLWEWLERLSGPGPFHGWAAEVPVVCRVIEVTETGTVRTIKTAGNSSWHPIWRCWSPSLLFTGDEKPSKASRYKRQYFSLYVGHYTGNASDLAYAVEPLSRKIIWWKIGTTFTWEVHDLFDLHTGIQWNHLSSDAEPPVFDSLSAPSIELMGITWWPFGECKRCWPVLHYVGIPLRANLLARSFDASDFGAIPGTFKSRPEVQFQWGVVVDLWKH
jgi:hypothetical protein